MHLVRASQASLSGEVSAPQARPLFSCAPRSAMSREACRRDQRTKHVPQIL